MIHLHQTLKAWGTDDFELFLRQELEGLNAGDLPLQEGLERGSSVADEGFRVMLIAAEDAGDRLCATVGVFYTGIIAGCSCADDPTPVEGHPEYCELRVEIGKKTAAATFGLLPG
jgi:hypothetical protein